MARWIAPITRFAIYIRDDWECAFCGCEIGLSNATLDHLHPRRYRNGRNSATNLVACCRDCNLHKNGKTWREFSDREAVARIMRRKQRVLPDRTKLKLIFWYLLVVLRSQRQGTLIFEEEYETIELHQSRIRIDSRRDEQRMAFAE